ncbi:MAG: hydrogenase iron-sulfur subunit [Spirochaetales bacterium]|nr:hydrogenase iron-sulfur subunit [Spirochaetales bacterium]
MSPDFKPRIIAFLCNWCSYEGADRAGGQKLPYSATVKLIRVMCSGRVDPQFIFDAFRKGADGVMVLGCHPGDCHYRNGNMNAMRRMVLIKKMLKTFGIHPDRVKLDWVAASESRRFQQVVNDMADRILKLGPLSLKGCVKEVVEL